MKNYCFAILSRERNFYSQQCSTIVQSQLKKKIKSISGEKSRRRKNMDAERDVTTAPRSDQRRDVNRQEWSIGKTGRSLGRGGSATEKADAEADDEGTGHLRPVPRELETLQVILRRPLPSARPSPLSIAVTTGVLCVRQRSFFGNARVSRRSRIFSAFGCAWRVRK